MKNTQRSGLCNLKLNKCNAVKHAQLSNVTSKLTGNLEVISLFCLYLVNNVIKLPSQNHEIDL